MIVAAAVVAVAATSSAAGRGVQFSPDGKRVLVSKDVNNERWAITLNRDDGTATGNVFRQGGGAPAFIACDPLSDPNAFACFGTDACSTGGTQRGIQRTPDGKRILVNKDVNNERWAITLNDDGTAIGNVFRQGGGPPAFIVCDPLPAPHTFACYGADECAAEPCTDQFTFIANVTLPSDFFELPLPCPEQFTFIADVTLPSDFFAVGAVDDFLSQVETADGARGVLQVGVAPIPSSNTQTVADNFDFNAAGVGTTSPNDKVIAGGSNMLGLDFNAAAASLEFAAAEDPTLIVAVQRRDGTFLNGYFEVPLQSLTGQETLTSIFSQQLGNQPFSLAFATRSGGVVSRYTAFPQQPVQVTPSSLTISLSIYPSQDLDLFLWEPGQDPYQGDPGICLRGSRCFQTSPNGGRLDLDANRECTFNVGVNNEHITYPGVVLPRGLYRVGVGFFQNCTGSGAAFTVVVSAGTQRLITDGFFSSFQASPGTAKIVQSFRIL
jgi:hypothetical protein